jgi:3-phosphoshikimate 1-carboxyvinyltransferase
MASPTSVVVWPARTVRGRVRVPGDKSISHRYALLASIAQGRSRLEGFAPGADCRSTLGCLAALGVDMGRAGDTVTIIGRGLRAFRSPASPLDAGNSGTTARLLAGLLAFQPLSVTLAGDDSLARRPMRRVIEPLTRMGARIESADGRLPMTISGGELAAIDCRTEVPSAQVKSAVLLAGLGAAGTTRVTEPSRTRNHTELALGRFGADVAVSGLSVSVVGRSGRALRPTDARVPGDFSSAAFWWAAAAGLPGSDIVVEGVGLNPTRTALLDVLRRAGVAVEMVERRGEDEPLGDVRVRGGRPAPLLVEPAEVPGLIDEIPALAAMASFGGELSVSGASELRVKESDRIAALVGGFRLLGAEADEWSDGFHLSGRRRLRGGLVDAAGDHRLAMAFAVAALGASGPTTITGAGAVDVSYPGFFAALESLAA